MTTVALASLHGAPGATTLAVGLASTITDAVLLEADPAGGVLAARCGLAREPGLVSFAADRDALGIDGLRRHAQVTESGLPVLPCSESAEHTTLLLRAAADDVASRLADADIVVDVGRLGVDSPSAPLVGRSDALIVVTRPTVEALAVLVARLPSLDQDRLIVALVGDRPYGPNDVVAELGLDAFVLADDPRAVEELWSGGGRRRSLARSAWARSVRELAGRIAARESVAR